MDDTLEKASPVNRIENVAIGDMSRVSSAIFLLLCVLPVFSTVLFGAVDNSTWIIISIFWAAIILLWLVESSKAKGLLFIPNLLQIPVAGLLLIGLVQLLPLGGGISIDPYATRFFVIRLIVYLTFFAACLTFINNEGRLKKVVFLVITFGAAMAFIGILLRLANPEGVYGIRKTPQAIPFGPFVNQHHFASFMQMAAAPAVAFLFGKDTGRDKKLLLLMAVVVMGAATVLTSSRGGVLGFGSMVAFVVLVNFFSRERAADTEISAGEGTQRKIVLAASGAAIILVIFGVVIFLGGGDALFRGVGLSNAEADLSTGRAHYWPIAIRIFLEHPLLGAGFEAFGAAYSKFDTWNGLLRVEQAHNEYLQTLADSGLAGFACLVAFIYLLFKKGLGMVAGAGSSFRRNAAIGALAGCFGILIHSFFDFPLRTPSNAFFFLLLAAIATVSIKTDSDVSVLTRRKRRSTSP